MYCDHVVGRLGTGGFSCRWMSLSPMATGTARSPQCCLSRVKLHPVAAHDAHMTHMHTMHTAHHVQLPGAKTRDRVVGSRTPEQFAPDATLSAANVAELLPCWREAQESRCRWRHQHVHCGGIYECVGGAVALKHYCPGRGGRIARQTLPSIAARRAAWPRIPHGMS